MSAASIEVLGGIVRPRSFRIELPPRTILLTSNDRLNKFEQSKRVKALRHTGRTVALACKVPQLERAHIFYILHPNTTTRRRDPGNWAPSAKAAVDGLVDAGVLPDDNHERLLGPDPRIGTPVPGSQLVLVVTDLDSIDAAHLALLNPPGGTS